ncbi:MAG: phosphatase PAP2 family protein [Candidatus Omnitrophota bacterium]|jgi:undecaprenyl-diphosphatase
MLRYIDRTSFFFINHGFNNPLFDLIMPVISKICGGPVLFAVSVALLFSRRKDLRILGLIMLAGFTVSFYLVSALKAFIARPRPFLALTDVYLLAKEKSMSFPSSHATSSFMAATILTAYFKKYAVIFYSFAAAVAFSRVYIGVHYPSDVLAGALLGIAIGWILLRVRKAIS